MDLNEILLFLNKFARQNTFISMVIIAIVGNILTQYYHKLIFFLSTSSKFFAKKIGKGIYRWNQKKLEFLQKKYTADIINVEKIKNKEQNIYYELVQDLYYSLTLFFTITILYFIIIKVDNPILFYGFLGAASRYIFIILAMIYYNNSLFENARNFEKYRRKKQAKIKRIENLLNNKYD